MSTKKNIYIHIGNHKTGTSSLQYFLKKKKNVFLRLNYHYAVEKKAINHHNISWQAIKHFYNDKNKQKSMRFFRKYIQIKVTIY